MKQCEKKRYGGKLNWIWNDIAYVVIHPSGRMIATRNLLWNVSRS